MQIVNQKDRTYATWRFAGIYLLSVALPVLLVLNARSVDDASRIDYERELEKFKKKEKAMAQVAQLAATLGEVQRLKPPYAKDAIDPAKYDQTRFKFEKDVDDLKRLYFEDTALYKAIHSQVILLENNHKAYQKTEEEFNKQVASLVDARVEDMMQAARKEDNGNGGSSNGAQVEVLNIRLQTAQDKISDLREQLAKCTTNQPTRSTAGSPTVPLADLQSAKAQVDRAFRKLREINTECQNKGIRKRDAKEIIEKISTDIQQFLKSEEARSLNSATAN